MNPLYLRQTMAVIGELAKSNWIESSVSDFYLCYLWESPHLISNSQPMNQSF